MKIEMNLLKTEFEDREKRYVGMWSQENGGHKTYNDDPKNLFNAIRNLCGNNTKIYVKSDEEKEIFSEYRTVISKSELAKIVKEQQNGGHDVELIA